MSNGGGAVAGFARWRGMSVLAVLAVILAACSWPGGQAPVTAEDPAFAGHLAEAYDALADEIDLATVSSRVRQVIGDKQDSARTERRSEPESPGEWFVAPSLATNLLAQRAALNRALAGSARTRLPQAAARAQARYDCAVMAHADAALAPVRQACYDAFRRSLSAVERAGLDGQPQGLADEVVFFAPGSSDLTAAGREALSRVVDQIPREGGPVLVIGHADRISDPAARSLGMQRAEAVRTALVAAGVAPDRIDPHDEGIRSPLLSEAGAAAMNRRVEVWIL